MMDSGDDDARLMRPLAELTSAASLDALNAALASERVDAARIVAVVFEPAFFDPVGRLVKPAYRVLYRRP
ncbi:hypothetical protein [Chelatococcus asaccharovorans]|uniref:Uncharacterized protein n=1 Tax=Chelatococcus asaccharovorans TaxID=28210 RepID=A0A2V3UIB8_9HYPH|nr:hypothetical protein [Chelatococcus asaccharovorans]MBS7701727.1 hypothetical protein [Chelatococcus asaccharovorans]PXW64567.1 hypothetical protein C7450_101323 [Chelatococcus asaccharovorans]